MADKDKLNRQKESIRLEKEYQQTLSFSAQVQRDLNKEINKGVDARTKHGKAIREHNKEMMKGLGSLTSSIGISKKIVEIENQNLNLSKSKNGYNKEEVNQKIKNNNFVLQGLKLDYERVAAAEQLDDVQKDVTKGIQDQITKIKEFGSNIPIVGGLFKSAFGKSFDRLNKDISSAGKELVTSFGKGGMSLKNLTGSMSQFGSSMMAALATNPVVLLGIAIAAVVGVIYLIAKAFEVGLARFKELDAAAKSFRNETGLLVSQTRAMQENIRSTSLEFANLGVSAEDVSKAAGEFVNEFDGLEQPSKAVLGSLVMMNKNFGVGTQEAIKLNKVFQNIGGLTAEQSQNLIGSTVQMAKMAGVAPNKVIKDMAESSEYAYKYFKGSPKELAKAAVQAAKMGTSIAEAGKAADNLLDFQSSISKELEASAILGVNLNLSQARYAAANGDLAGQQQAINDQVAKLGDLTKLNTFEQQALADATGMEFSSLVNQQRIRQKFGNLQGEQLASAMALMDAGKDINKLTEKDLQLQTQKMKSQKDMQSVMDNISNETGALKSGFADMLAPMAGFVMNNLLDALQNIGKIAMPIFKGLGALARIFFGILGMVADVAQAVLGPIFAIAGAILDVLIAPIMAVAEKMQPLFDKFKELKEVTMAAIQPILGVISSIGTFIGDLVSGPVGFLVDALVWGFGIVFDIIGGIGTAIGYILSPIMTVINGIGAGISFVGGLINDYLIQPMKDAASLVTGFLSSVTFGLIGGDDEESTTSSGSINDGVVQDGKVVSTNPADFLLATKDPAGLAQELGGGGGVGVDMSGVIAELQSLKSAFLSNKDVYMDKSLVTSAVTNTQERSGRENRFGLQGA